MKRLVSLFLVFFMLANLVGCEAVKKKFRRKKKEAVKMPRIYQVRKYEKRPTPELYKKHYAFWSSWQSELIGVIGQNSKKDKRCIEEIISNLEDMQNILVKEKADKLEPHIDKMMSVKDTIFRDELNPTTRDYLRRVLEREERFIKKEFVFEAVRNYIKTSFEEEPADLAETQDEYEEASPDDKAVLQNGSQSGG